MSLIGNGSSTQFPFQKIVSQHHFCIENKKGATHFRLVAESLKPYCLSEGKWCVLLDFIAVGKGSTFGGRGVFGEFVRVTSPEVVSGLEKRLNLGSFSLSQLHFGGGFIQFSSASPQLVRYQSDHLTFNLTTIDGREVQGEGENCALALGIRLIQIE